MKKNKIKKLSFVFIIIFIFLPTTSFSQQENISCNDYTDCPAYYTCEGGYCVPDFQGPSNNDQIPCTNDNQCPDGQICELALGYCSEQLQTTEYTTTDHSDLADGIEKEKIKPIKTPDLNPLGKLNVKIPGIDELAAKYPIICNEEEVGKGGASCKIPWIAIYIYAVYNYLLGIGGFLAAIALMIGGVLWLISAGNANRVSQAKSWITGSLTGLLILLTSYVFLYEINPNLLLGKYIEVETISGFDLPEEAQILAPSSGPSSHGVPLYYQCSEEGKKILYNDKGKRCPEVSSYTAIYGTQDNPISPYKGTPNLCISGCGVLSTFMAINKYKTENNLEQFTRNAENIGARGAGCNGSSYIGLINLAKSYGLEAADAGGKNGIIKKLDEGCVVVAGLSASGAPSCRFTGGGHFILLTGWRERGNLIVDVNDPAGSNAYPYKGECATKPTTCKTWLSLNDFGNCSLLNSFYICAP